jgi:hypothetical protein
LAQIRPFIDKYAQNIIMREPMMLQVWRKFDNFSMDVRKSIIPREHPAGSRDALGLAQIRQHVDKYAQIGSNDTECNDTRSNDAWRNGKRSKRCEALA